MIVIRSPQEIEKIRKSNKVVAEILGKFQKEVSAGMSTVSLDQMAERIIRERGGIPAFKGYRDFPATVCVSVNEQVVHGIPSEKRKLKNGDIVSIDLGVLLGGYFGDSAITIGVGSISAKAKKLMEVTEDALYVGIKEARAGNHLYEISQAVQEFVEGLGYSVVRDFVGHGIGTSLHEEPQVPNFKPDGNGMGPILKNGMVLAIEPMVNVGTYKVKILKDNWTAITADRKLSAHFEHSIAITDGKADILSVLN